MRRFIVLLLIAVAAGAGIWYSLRGAAPRRSSSDSVTALLPKETLAFVYLPDFKRSREQWHGTELYKLWREPAVQDFLQRPLAKVPRTNAMRQKLQEMEALDAKDTFVAVTAFAEKRPKLLAGFRFKGDNASAEKVIGPWRARLREKMPGAKHETVAYEGHQIEVVSENAITAATVYAGDWFFASNDLPSLQALLDRADQRNKDGATTLTADEFFIAAVKHRPVNYAVFGYARLDRVMEKLADKAPPEAKGSEQIAALRQIHSISGTTSFQDGKIRDVTFVAMPKLKETGELTRSSLSLATKETFLYLTSVLNLQQITMPNPQATGAGGVPVAMQRFFNAFTANGITRDDWTAAFAPELGLIGDWPEGARMPALFAAIALKDAARARKILTALTAAAPEENPWVSSEREGVLYYSQPPANPMVPVTPTIALSPQLLVAGLDAGSVEAAIKRGASGNSELANASDFKSAEKWVPAPQQSFTYIDLALLYTRLDTTLRPMLVMAAAFVPKITETVDLGKLPAAEVITRHLSPLVVSQSYDGDGYVTESVGPVSIYETALGIIGASGAGATIYQQQMRGRLGNSPVPSAGSSAPLPDEPSPTPAGTP
ncbi:MAG TPA: hypothetical protein VK474_04330 [Chthoniobacterales bacterium]|nr:hypothetical protein [Chthoniobacterales bacterium]